MMKYLRLMRVHHCIKNGLIFLPLLFGGRLQDPNLLFKTICGFIAFSFLSSIVYIINDCKDLERDRLHSTKCKRPIASGAVSVRNASFLACFLAVFSLVFHYLASGTDLAAWAFFALYFGLNLGYSLGLKNVPIVDIVILVSGFLLRVLYGSAITEIVISNWLYLTVISMCFYLGLGKRRNELMQQSGGQSRKVLQYYNHAFLDKNMSMCLGLTITFYSLWSVDPLTIQRLSTTALVWTVPLVIVICMKYSLSVEGYSDGDPVEVVLRDRVLLALIGIYFSIICGILYL